MSIFEDSDNSATSRAMTMAREIVKGELESIDRMHNRTLRYITGYMTAVLIGFGFLGWLGYDKLEGIVETEVSRKVQEQTLQRVNHQVDQDLKNSDVEGIIARKITDFASSDLRAVLTAEVRHSPVHDEIRRVALAASASSRSQTAQPNVAQRGS